MADTYADSQIAAGKPARAVVASGVNRRTRVITFETAAAYAAGEIKRLFPVGAHEIPLRCQIVNDAIAGATDVEIGLWRRNSGVVIDQDCLMGTLDINAGKAWSSPGDGLGALGVEQVGIQSFREIAVAAGAADAIGHIPDDSYDFAMIFNSDVSAAGTITVVLDTLEQQ